MCAYWSCCDTAGGKIQSINTDVKKRLRRGKSKMTTTVGKK